MTLRRSIAPTALVACAIALAGCVSTTRIYDQQGTSVHLASRGGKELGLNQPVTIAPVRLTYILAAIDIRFSSDDNQLRAPAFYVDSLDAIAEALAFGLQKAGPDQRVVVYSVRHEKRFGIFDTNFLTSFIAYVYGEHLFVHLSRSDWEIPPRKKDRLPAPKIGKFPMKFRILPSKGMKPVDEQSVAIAWRDDAFSKPTRLRMTPTGKLVRKTILMESEEPETDSDTGSGADRRPGTGGSEPDTSLLVPSGISPQTLRALADLEERRQRGQVSEYDYEQQRRQILEADAASRTDNAAEPTETAPTQETETAPTQETETAP